MLLGLIHQFIHLIVITFVWEALVHIVVNARGKKILREEICHPNTFYLPNLFIQQVFIEGLLCARHCSGCDRHVPGNLLFLMKIEIIKIHLTCLSVKMNKDMSGLQIT